MNCSRAERWLNLYVDGRLDARRLPALEDHILACAHCRTELALFESIHESLVDLQAATEPDGLTERILDRIAAYESRRVAAQARAFSLRWSDGLLAALLASVTTLLFVLLDPPLRASVPQALSHAFPGVFELLTTTGPGSIAWVAWIVWVAAGLMLAIWFAGAEVRSSWRRSLSQRMPQFPQLW
jgi:anti-sigma factor RsiW